ncbi:MlaA family lipoprotein [Sphingomonas sp. Tas61C01]|uniref:MlaA family lipoprotein n=1 Tax=Sphingomonas sp. Tas61C01 TaxID=3458297 RepID=UPI00403EBEA4
MAAYAATTATPPTVVETQSLTMESQAGVEAAPPLVIVSTPPPIPDRMRGVRPPESAQPETGVAETGVAEAGVVESDIVVTGRNETIAPDPMRAINETSFKATQAVDGAIVGPLARAYAKAAPRPFRSGVHNVLYNLREPVVFVNFLLQHKIGKAAETVGRFAINTTIGVAGLFDIAKRKPFRLPRRGNGFADTLGFYGVPNGPFMFLPIVGPTTVRDLFGGTIDRLILPIAFGGRITRPEVAIPLGVLGALDHRSEFDGTLHKLHDNAADPYANTRRFYLRRRQAEIDHLRGRGTGSSSPMSEVPTTDLDERGRELPTTPLAPAPGK